MFRKERLIVFLFPLLLSLPFINRAFFVDDNYFVEIAEWLVENPEKPYHFRTDDAGPQNRGWEEDGFVRMVNPLAHHYYLGALIKLGGTSVWFLRLGTVLLSCFGALFLFGLARRWTNQPLLATLLVLVTPTHWLTAHSLLIDSTMGFLFLGGLYYFILGIEREEIKWVILSGVFMGGAILTKYTALLIIPLTGLWWLFRWKKLAQKWKFTLAWVIALLFLGAYSMWTAHLYGEPHILAASNRMMSTFGLAKYFVFFIFLSGVTLVPLIIWGMFERKILLFNIIFVLLLTRFLSSAFGGYSISQSFIISLFFITSFLFISLLITNAKKWIYPRDPMLIGWFFGFCAMMFVVMGWVAGRYYLIVAPAVVFLSIRLVEMKWPIKSEKIIKAMFLSVFIFTSALAYADYRQASPARDLIQQLKNHGFQGGERHFYLGDSFTMSYLKKQGWVPCFPETELQVGDQVLIKEVTMPLIWFFRKYKQGLRTKEVYVFNYPTWFPLKVMDFKGSAGFYATVWGTLPFTFSSGPWERFRLVEITEIRQSN